MEGPCLSASSYRPNSIGETFLVDAASRARANLTRQKNIAEGVISPDVRTAVGILIHHRKERLRKGCCFYRVVLNDVMVATKVQFDTVTEQHKDVGICNEIV